MTGRLPRPSRWLVSALALNLALMGLGLVATGEASEPAEIAVTGISELCFPGTSFCAGDAPFLMIVLPPDAFSWLPGGELGSAPSWSPDGRQIAFAELGGEIFVVDASGGVPVNLTNHPASNNWAPAWSPDGSQIAFASDRDGTAELYVMNADGSSPVRLTTGSGLKGPVHAWSLTSLTGRLTWSPDRARIAFDCEVAAGNLDICVVTVADGAVVRLTSHPSMDVDPAWSPDGTRIAFASDRTGLLELYLMQSDGSGVAAIGTGIAGMQPAWSPDGEWIAFARVWDPGSGCFGVCTYVLRADGTRLRLMPGGGYPGGGFEPAWKPTGTTFNEWPVATFTDTCSGRACTFDASGSHDPDGSVTSYAWGFGDGSAAGSGAAITHTYFAPGTYAVTLTVIDDGGTATSETRSVTVQADPSRMHVGDLDASGAGGPGGWTASVKVSVHRDGHRGVADARVVGAWSDGTAGACTTNVNGRCTVSRSGVSKATVSLVFTVARLAHARLTYVAAYNHDPDGDSDGTSITVTRPSMHVGDLDASSTSQVGGWAARVKITVRNGAHGGVFNARVTGAWSDGPAGACTTNVNGRCAVSRSGVPPTTTSLTFTVAGVAHARLTYSPADNQDPDGDSDGTSITVAMP